MHRFRTHRTLAAALVLLLIAVPGQARRLMELDGIELRGTARVLTYGAATCHVLEEKYSEEDYARLKANEGQPLDLWQLDFAVYNGSGKALDHLIARYGIEAEWPPCTNWNETVDYPGPVSWADEAGSIQRGGTAQVVAPGETVTKTIYIIAYHTDEPRFARWSVDYTFAEGTHAAPEQQPAQEQATPQAELPPSQTQTAAPPLSQASGLPSGISTGDACAGKPAGSACWLELDTPPGCYLWIPALGENMTATWSGECANGLADGAGEFFQVWGSEKDNTRTGTGQFRQGKQHGLWNLYNFVDTIDVKTDGNGDYVAFIRKSNTEYKGHFADGKMHGRWVINKDDGTVSEGNLVEGKQHGHWVIREADGLVSEGPYVDGKRHGYWVYHLTIGGTQEGPYVEGERHGVWVNTGSDGSIDIKTTWSL